MVWVRTQDKESLQNVKAFWLERKSLIGAESQEYNLEGEASVSNSCILASFPTKGAALEELDRIEEWIAGGASGVYQVSGG